MWETSAFDVRQIMVRPIVGCEQARFERELGEHHWLGHRLVGETMRYVAVSGDGDWLAVLGFRGGCACLRSSGPIRRLG